MVENEGDKLVFGRIIAGRWGRDRRKREEVTTYVK